MTPMSFWNQSPPLWSVWEFPTNTYRNSQTVCGLWRSLAPFCCKSFSPVAGLMSCCDEAAGMAMSLGTATQKPFEHHRSTASLLTPGRQDDLALAACSPKHELHISESLLQGSIYSASKRSGLKRHTWYVFWSQGLWMGSIRNMLGHMRNPERKSLDSCRILLKRPNGVEKQYRFYCRRYSFGFGVSLLFWGFAGRRA